MPTIRELRKQKRWSQTRLAQEASLSITTISKLERGEPVQLSTATLAALALGVKLSQVEGVNISDQVSREGA